MSEQFDTGFVKEECMIHKVRFPSIAMYHGIEEKTHGADKALRLSFWVK